MLTMIYFILDKIEEANPDDNISDVVDFYIEWWMLCIIILFWVFVFSLLIWKRKSIKS